MLSMSRDVPQTMLSIQVGAPHDVLAVAVPHTMLSSRPSRGAPDDVVAVAPPHSVPHTMLSSSSASCPTRCCRSSRPCPRRCCLRRRRPCPRRCCRLVSRRCPRRCCRNRRRTACPRRCSRPVVVLDAPQTTLESHAFAVGLSTPLVMRWLPQMTVLLHIRRMRIRLARPARCLK